MRSTALTILFSPLLYTFVSAITHDCGNILADGKKFDLSKLEGRHSVWTLDEDRPPAVYNTTWTIDLCKPLPKLKEIPDADQCPSGTYICGAVRSWNPTDDPDKKQMQLENVIPVAGVYSTSTGKNLDPKYTRIKATDNSPAGLQIELNGGTWDKRAQRAIIDIQCDKDRTGNEGKLPDPKSKFRRDEKDEKSANNSLSFVSYTLVDDEKTIIDVLRLKWLTQYVCEEFKEEQPVSESKSWGFFTWFILIAFLSIAAYLIFGSWLNYNRYGARGWDLLPHGDTIRDIPYLFRDWSRNLINMVTGSGSRGGYSAV